MKKCKAVEQSGHRCQLEEGHKKNHRVVIVWDTPKNGAA